MKDEYQAAFDEEVPAKPEVTEEEAFGLMPEEMNSADTPAEAPAVAVVIQPEAPEGESPKMETPEMAEGMPAEEEVSPEDMQRQKSWEGRLKKREEELKAREAEMMAAPPVQQGLVDSAAVDEAKVKLAEDFGDDFVALISTIAAGMAQQTVDAIAAQKVQSIDSSIAGIIEQIRDANERAHFERIYDAHEDFADIAQSPEFQTWAAEDPDRARIAEGGNAREIVKLLSEWKAMSAPEEESGDDDTEAVRSGGLKLPAPGPGMSGDYADAWKEF